MGFGIMTEYLYGLAIFGFAYLPKISRFPAIPGLPDLDRQPWNHTEIEKLAVLSHQATAKMAKLDKSVKTQMTMEVDKSREARRPLLAGDGGTSRQWNHGQPKGESYVVDDCCNTDSSVAAGAGQQLHDGWVHSPPAGGCRCRGAGQNHSGTTAGVRSR
jgi:hypothetical protein